MGMQAQVNLLVNPYTLRLTCLNTAFVVIYVCCTADNVHKQVREVIVTLAKGQGGTQLDGPYRRQWGDSWQVRDTHIEYLSMCLTHKCKHMFKRYEMKENMQAICPLVSPINTKLKCVMYRRC